MPLCSIKCTGPKIPCFNGTLSGGINPFSKIHPLAMGDKPHSVQSMWGRVEISLQHPSMGIISPSYYPTEFHPWSPPLFLKHRNKLIWGLRFRFLLLGAVQVKKHTRPRPLYCVYFHITGTSKSNTRSTLRALCVILQCRGTFGTHSSGGNKNT